MISYFFYFLYSPKIFTTQRHVNCFRSKYRNGIFVFIANYEKQRHLNKKMIEYPKSLFLLCFSLVAASPLLVVNSMATFIAIRIYRLDWLEKMGPPDWKNSKNFFSRQRCKLFCETDCLWCATVLTNQYEVDDHRIVIPDKSLIWYISFCCNHFSLIIKLRRTFH